MSCLDVIRTQELIEFSVGTKNLLLNFFFFHDFIFVIRTLNSLYAMIRQACIYDDDEMKDSFKVSLYCAYKIFYA